MYVLFRICRKQKIKSNLGNFLKSFVVIDSKWALSFRIAAKVKNKNGRHRSYWRQIYSILQRQ